MSDVQARPAQLKTFSTNGVTITTALSTDRASYDNAFIAFRAADSQGFAAQGDAVVGQAMTALISELREIPAWVKLVHDALIEADVTSADGSVSISSSALTLRMVDLAGGEENFKELANSRELNITPPMVAPSLPTPAT